MLQDQFYAKTLGVRQSRRATLTALQARSFLSCWPFSIAPPHGALSHPLAALFSVPIEFSQRQNEDQLDRMGGPLDA